MVVIHENLASVTLRGLAFAKVIKLFTNSIQIHETQFSSPC